MRRLMALVLLGCVGWSSVEVLWAEESLPIAKTAVSAVATTADPDSSGDDDCACLCACGCHAARVVVEAAFACELLLTLVPIEAASRLPGAPHDHFATPPVPPPIAHS
jgi:hypothetical protein